MRLHGGPRGGSLFNIDVWLKKAIENDLVPGPRLAASGREICGVGGLMDWNPDFRKIGMEGLVLLVNGPDEARGAVRKLVKDGVEWVKTYPTGDAAAPDTNDHHTLCMTFEEMHAVVASAHNHGLKVTGHCRATEGIKNALRAGYDTIEHGTFMDDEASTCCSSATSRACRRCSSSWHRSTTARSSACSQTGDRRPQGDARRRRDKRPQDPEGRRPAGHGRRLRLRLEPARRLRQGADLLRQVRRLQPAGNDHVRDADRRRDHGPRHEIGTLEAGKLADVLVVDGDVLADIAVLEDRSRFLAVMQGGIVKAGTLAARQPLVMPGT